MTWAGVGGAAVGVIGGLISSNSAKNAAAQQQQAAQQASQQQLQAAQQANQLNASIYKQNLLNGQPYAQGGQVALSALMGGLGLGGAQAGAPYGSASPGVQAPAGTFTNAQGQPVDAQGNVITQAPDASYGIGNIQTGATQQQLDQAGNLLAPGSLTHQFSGADLLAGIDPGYQFRMDQGNAALNARRAAMGNRLGGQALKDISDYNQGAASQEYGNAYNRYQTNQSNIYTRLANLAGIGQTQTNQNANLGSQTAGQMGSNTIGAAGASGNYLTSGASAGAAGQIGSTNSIVGGLQSGLGNYYLGQMFNKPQQQAVPGGAMVNGGGFSNFPAYLLSPNGD